MKKEDIPEIIGAINYSVTQYCVNSTQMGKAYEKAFNGLLETILNVYVEYEDKIKEILE